MWSGNVCSYVFFLHHEVFFCYMTSALMVSMAVYSRYHMYGASTGQVQLITNVGGTNSVKWQRQGSQSNYWVQAAVTIQSNTNYQVRVITLLTLLSMIFLLDLFTIFFYFFCLLGTASWCSSQPIIWWCWGTALCRTWSGLWWLFFQFMSTAKE